MEVRDPGPAGSTSDTPGVGGGVLCRMPDLLHATLGVSNTKFSVFKGNKS